MATILTTIDIETIPEGSLKDFKMKKTAPKTIKDDIKIKKWNEDNQIKEFRDRAKNPYTAQIICLGFAFENENNLRDEPECQAIYGDNEEEVLSKFEKILKDNLSESFFEGEEREVIHDIRWMGFNIRKYDLEALWLKAIKYELYFLAKLIPRGRYDKSVYDLMEKMTGPRAEMISFDNCLKLLQIGHKTDGMDGSKVYDKYLNGELKSTIVPYCIDDIMNNLKMYKKINKGIIA